MNKPAPRKRSLADVREATGAGYNFRRKFLFRDDGTVKDRKS